MNVDLDGLHSVSLQQLDGRAALLRRGDRKYVVEPEQLERLADDHDVLEIDGRRRFSYDTVYYDTEDLRRFRDHNEDVRPRFKARRRCYVDAGDCVFEVKVKHEDGETDKRQDDDLEATLRETGIEPPGDLREVLRTSFDRVTLAAREGGARLTIDLGVTLSTMDGESVRMRDGLALMETKREDGESAADGMLRGIGARPVSLSKYRVGIDALVQRGQNGDLADVRQLFI
jgi:hypothetical protein